MEYVLEERIGNPDLFTGRKKELAYFIKWINDIKEKKSQSTAMLARRKMGKTALMERLFNITFFKRSRLLSKIRALIKKSLCAFRLSGSRTGRRQKNT